MGDRSRYERGFNSPATTIIRVRHEAQLRARAEFHAALPYVLRFDRQDVARYVGILSCGVYPGTIPGAVVKNIVNYCAVAYYFLLRGGILNRTYGPDETHRQTKHIVFRYFY